MFSKQCNIMSELSRIDNVFKYNELPPHTPKNNHRKFSLSYDQQRVTNGRDSSIELLRIVAMLLVLLGHYVPVRMQPTAITAMDRPFDTLFELELNSITFVCVNVFVLISGYFSIRPKRSSLKRLLLQILFWSFFTSLIGLIIWPDSINLLNGWLSFITVLRQWFVFSYLGLFLFAPVLNSYLDSTSSHKIFQFTCLYMCFSIFFGYICYGFWGTPKDFLEGMSILSLIGLYLIGTCLRRYKDSTHWLFGQSATTYLLSYVALTIFQTIFAFILLRWEVKSCPYGYMNPIILLESVCLFMFFAKLKMRRVRWINFLASSAFAAYLLHCSPALSTHFWDSFKWIEADFSLSLPIALCYLIAIYVVAVLIDKAWWGLFEKLKFVKRL